MNGKLHMSLRYIRVLALRLTWITIDQSPSYPYCQRLNCQRLAVRIRKFFESKRLLTSYHYSFREGLSCELSLNTMIEGLKLSLDNRNYVRSVLGPLLFLIFINDFPLYLSKINSTLFADDTTLLFDCESMDSGISKFKNGIKHLNEWCKHNKLYINWSKTFIKHDLNMS